MNLKYIVNKEGQRRAVQLPIKEWEKIEKELEELKRLKNKKYFMVELAEAVEEVNMIKKYKSKTRNAEDFLNEL